VSTFGADGASLLDGDCGGRQAEAVQSERNRAVVAQSNAEIRRGKASLRGDFPKLHKLARKKPKLAAKNGGLGGSLEGSLRQVRTLRLPLCILACASPPHLAAGLCTVLYRFIHMLLRHRQWALCQAERAVYL
jgi:hypothetical protein